MKLSELQTNRDAILEESRNPAFRAEWERTAVARAVASTVLQYRTEHGLSQRALAHRLGMKQPQVARIERGGVNPSIDTLIRLVSTLGIELTIDISPADRAPRLVNKLAQSHGHAIASYKTDQAGILLAAA